MHLFSPFSEEKLCPLRASIDVLEGEYFFLCYLESRQEHFQEEAYTINWYKESAGKQQLVKETHRIVSQMNFLEFWPAELSDSGNYSVIHRWVHIRMYKCLACAHVCDEDNFFVLFCIDSGIHIKGAQGTALTAVSFPTSFHNNYQGEPLTSTNVYKEFQPFKCSAHLLIRQVAFLLACD